MAGSAGRPFSSCLELERKERRKDLEFPVSPMPAATGRHLGPASKRPPSNGAILGSKPLPHLGDTYPMIALNDCIK